MEYVYTAMLLHSAGTEVSAKSVEKVLKAAGVKADKSRAEALVASLEGVDIEEAMATASSSTSSKRCSTSSSRIFRRSSS